MARPFYLQTTAFYTGLVLTLCAIAPLTPAHAGFDPDTGSATVSATPPLPDPSEIYGRPRVVAVTPGYASPLAPVQMPGQPLYPSLVDNGTAPAVALAPAPGAPAIIAAAPAANGFIAPAPVLAENPLAQPSAHPAPEKLADIPANPPVVAVAPVQVVGTSNPGVPTITPVAATPAQVQTATQEAANVNPKMAELSPQTRSILSHIPGNLDKIKPQTGAIALDRVSPNVKDVLGDKSKEESYEAVGLSMKVRRPGLDENYELNRAYAALMGGDTDTAIETYKNILSTNPRNQDALFGLAATYHRLGNLEKARPLYGMLLQVNPNHREGLNNFLALVADESPQDALPELERLEARNPEFSPIPAQIAVVLEKTGYQDEAREKMLRAIELAPDNLTYKYNLAVMLDHQGQSADASALYKMLIDSSLHGESVPAPVAVMQKRVNFLANAINKPVAIPTASATPANSSAAVN